MAQLKDLIVNGASNFLGVTSFNRVVTFNDDINFSSSSTLNLLNVTAAAHTSYTSPALVIGTSSGAHLEIDNTGILAKATASTLSTLYLNRYGSVVSFPLGVVEIDQYGINTTGTIDIENETQGTSSGGALQVLGGFSVLDNSYLGGTLTTNGSIIPAAAGKNLGSDSKRWSIIYSTTLNNAANATIGGTLGVTGAVTCSSSVTINKNLSVAAGASITGDTTITNGNLTVATASKQLAVAGTMKIGTNPDESHTLITKSEVESVQYTIVTSSHTEKAHFIYNTNDDSIDLIFN